MLQWELHVQLGWMKDADSAVGGLGSKFPDRGESRSKDLSAALPRVLWPCMTNLKLIVNWSTQQLNYLTALDEPSELNWLVSHWEMQILWPAFSGWCLDQALKIPGIISYSRRTSFCKLFIVAHEELSVLSSAVRCQLLLLWVFKSFWVSQVSHMVWFQKGEHLQTSNRLEPFI